MRLGILLLLLIATLFGSGYWYTMFQGVCATPIHYRIGEIDSRFTISKEELLRVAKKSEDMWEERIGQDLFIYDENAELPISLIFDARQENADREADIRDDLEAKEGMTESVAAQYERLIAEFRALKKKYESRVVSYETKLNEYNETVTDWNDKGGAPEGVIDELTATQKSLTQEQGEIEALSRKLNALASELNAIGAKGNSLITDYNSVVNKYNAEFSEANEFTQGDYTGEAIHIYQFDTDEELQIVLAHEFGHSLSLDHVQNEQSIMYAIMGGQKLNEGLSSEDTLEFNRVCQQKNTILSTIRAVVPFF